MAMIEVRDLTKYFGNVLAVDHVSFSVDKGEIVGFLGPNGAGKTTTMRILTTYISATSGWAKVAGYDVMQQSHEVRQNLGYLPEQVPLYPEMRVEEYLHYRARLKQVDRRQRNRRVEYVLERCRIVPVRRRLIGTLSRGYRQRVGLADALVHDPPILILDEPTSGLDPGQQQETLNLIRELGQDHTVLLSTHILPEVEEVCQRVIIINQGRIALQDRLSQLQRDSHIVLEVKAPEQEVQRLLQQVEGVRAIHTVPIEDGADGLCAFQIETFDNRDLRLAISERLLRQGWPIRRLDLKRRSLRDLFIQVTAGRASSYAA
ncbi:MAG: ATP-binding cassette domain-containing protein [Gemmatales bacterium]|nr:ABC transporter ATP-binding protein [Gemmatales bacterium]MCS7160177.1 ABC transporter ATP-binding protein [Gemmatales bacterium]MDW8175377.1 ATP-binding cassette domain-containing protein [Gemmatales bacterium]MDW8223635.1 ATP-binding cassette domain-containing protein [Gemmatales bacterium]